jgi:hypothetical protein
MTVTYSADVASSGYFTLSRLMLRWRGSVWQLVWHELLIWCMAYICIALIYRNGLNDTQRTCVTKFFISFYFAEHSKWLAYTVNVILAPFHLHLFSVSMYRMSLVDGLAGIMHYHGPIQSHYMLQFILVHVLFRLITFQMETKSEQDGYDVQLCAI